MSDICVHVKFCPESDLACAGYSTTRSIASRINALLSMRSHHRRFTVQLYGAGSDLVPVTLSFIDVSGNGHPNIIVHFENTRIVFVNENGGFRPATPQELPAIPCYLQQHGQ